MMAKVDPAPLRSTVRRTTTGQLLPTNLPPNGVGHYIWHLTRPQRSVEAISTPNDYIPVLIQTAIAVGFVGFALSAAAWLGPKIHGKKKDESFECGIEQHGNARKPFSVKYLLIAILFVLFDVEVIFLYPWAVHFDALGRFGLVEMFIFIVTVFVAYAYVWRRGGLDWD